ncbi:MAG TPA: ABC transporter permease [Lacunisphaera sp.]|nr:ABC transporter permease [Lacunisphaera sp.]
MLSDLRQACRVLTKAPGFSLVIIGSLALGIGANTVVFSWLRSAVFQPLPGVAAPVVLLETKDDTGNYTDTSWLEYNDLPALLPSFAAIAAQRIRALNVGDAGRDGRIFAEMVSGNFFSVLGQTPRLGRFFQDGEVTAPGSAAVAVIGYDFWQRYFAGSSDAIGRQLRLNGHAFTVIGVAPEGFRGGYNHLAFDVYLPFTMTPEVIPASSELRHRHNRSCNLLARLTPGVTLAQVRTELANAARHLIATYPETNRGLRYELLPLWRSPRGGDTVVTALATLQIFAVLILIVVCANTANLLLARASTRRREIGVRLAVGAGPGQIVTQLLLESVCVALPGAAAGLVVALWGIDALGRIPLPGNLPIRLAPELDWTSVAFAGGLAVACGLAFGLAPAMQLARGDVIQSLRGGPGSLGGRSRLRDLLIGLEVTVALVVLILAGLFLKSFRNAHLVSPGFDPGRVMLVSLDLGGRGYTGRTGGALLDDLLQRLASLPGVDHAAAANYVPLDVRGIPTGVISIEGKEFDPNRKILYSHVTPDYFASLGIPLLAGEDLSPRARTDLPRDAVISDEMARRYWPGENPVGHRFEVDGSDYVIKGVAQTPKLQKMAESPRPAAWLSMRDQFVSVPTLYVHVNQGDPAALLPGIRETVRQLDAELPILDARTLGQHVDHSLFFQRVPAHMLAVLGPLALALAAIGLYAVLAYAVAQRTQEIGVRLSLGATPESVVRTMMWQGMRVVLVAAAVGWLIALGAGWYLRDRLVAVPLGDPVIYAGIPALLLAVASLACWLPARRATKVDPLVALRAE